MNRYIVCLLSTILVLTSAISTVSADVFVPDVNIYVQANASTSSYIYPYVELEPNEFTRVIDSGSNALVSSTVRFTFSSLSFVPGVEYSFAFVIASPNAQLSVSNGSPAGSFVPSSGSPSNLTWGSDVNFSLVDTQNYPDPFNSTGSFDYANESYFISGSFVPSDNSGVLSLDIDFSGSSFLYYPGYAYLSFSATDEAYNQGLWANIYLTVNKIYSSLVNGFQSMTSSLTSINTQLSTSLSSITSDMGIISGKLDQIITALGNSDLSDVSVADLDQAASDMNNANDQLKDDISDINDRQDSFEDTSYNDSLAIEDFLSRFDAAPDDFYTSLRDSVRQLHSGLNWVSAFCGEVLRFEPLYSLFFVFTFMNLLFLIYNVSANAISRLSYRSRQAVNRANNINASKARAAENRSLYDQRARMRQHYGFTD